MIQIQKRYGLWVGGFGLAFLSSCGGGTPPAPAVQEQQANPWVLRLTSACNNIPKEQCAGAFGFAVDANGKYKVGPGPQGELIMGSVSKEHFDPLVKQLEAAMSTGQTLTGERCLTRVASEESTASMEYQTPSGEVQTLLRSNGAEFCHARMESEPANKLLGTLRDVALNYYPLPFPDDTCDHALGRLENLYEEARKCTLASDCAYVDEYFAVIPDNVVKIIATGDCSGVPAIISGNRAWVKERGFELVDAEKSARHACKRRQLTGVCSGRAEFKVTQPLPRCDAGVCRADPAAFKFFQE